MERIVGRSSWKLNILEVLKTLVIPTSVYTGERTVAVQRDGLVKRHYMDNKNRQGGVVTRTSVPDRKDYFACITEHKSLSKQHRNTVMEECDPFKAPKERRRTRMSDTYETDTYTEQANQGQGTAQGHGDATSGGPPGDGSAAGLSCYCCCAGPLGCCYRARPLGYGGRAGPSANGGGGRALTAPPPDPYECIIYQAGTQRRPSSQRTSIMGEEPE